MTFWWTLSVYLAATFIDPTRTHLHPYPPTSPTIPTNLSCSRNWPGIGQTPRQPHKGTQHRVRSRRASEPYAIDRTLLSRLLGSASRCWPYIRNRHKPPYDGRWGEELYSKKKNIFQNLTLDLKKKTLHSPYPKLVIICNYFMCWTFFLWRLSDVFQLSLLHHKAYDFRRSEPQLQNIANCIEFTWKLNISRINNIIEYNQYTSRS